MDERSVNILTFDVDWAPDFVLEDLLSLLDQFGVSSTWFFTHDSPFLKELRKREEVEIGIHPNFYESSTQGNTVEEIFDNLLNIVPEAVSFRSHSVYLNGHIYKVLLNRTPIVYDSTFFLPDHPLTDMVPYVNSSFKNEKVVYRVPFFWADDYLLASDKLFDKHPISFSGLSGIKVFCFHPIHVYLNTNCMDAFKKNKNFIYKERPDKISASSMKEGQKGVRDFLKSIIPSFSKRFYKMNELNHLEFVQR